MRQLPKKLIQKLRRPEVIARLLFGFELSQKQIELLQMNAGTQVVCAGRRFGKTSLVAAKAFHFCLLHPKARAIVAGPSLDQAKILFDLLTNAFETSPLRSFVKEVKLSPFPTVKLKNDAELTVRSTAHEGKYLRGRKTHLIILTEAAFIKDSVYHRVVLPMRLDTRATIILESTPNGHNYFYEEFQHGLNDGKTVQSFHATVYDNPAIAKEDIEDAKKRVPDYVWRQEYLAEFIDDDSAFFPWRILSEVLEDYKPVGYQAGRQYSIGVDLAKYRDYTVVVVLDVTEGPYRIAEFHRFNQMPYEETIRLINDVQARYKCSVFLDATGVGDPVSERINACVPFVFSQSSKSELLHNLLITLEQKKIVLPASNTVLRDELRFFRRVQSGSGFKLEAQAGYHDDCVMALALATWGTRTQQDAMILDKSDWGIW